MALSLVGQDLGSKLIQEKIPCWESSLREELRFQTTFFTTPMIFGDGVGRWATIRRRSSTKRLKAANRGTFLLPLFRATFFTPHEPFHPQLCLFQPALLPRGTPRGFLAGMGRVFRSYLRQ
jgi:hypothetical protein